VLVLQAPSGYGVRLVDRGGRVVASAVGPVPVAQEVVNVLLLNEVADGGAKLEALPQLVAPRVNVTQLRVARDFPDEALRLAGVDAVIVDNFDTAAMSTAQISALQDYVSLGGSLVLAGGSAWTRTLASLPPSMVPLHASAGGQASMSPLADLLGGTTVATAEVAKGDVTAGQVVVGTPEGPPLVVESEYRAGRVVQFTFDPLAEPIVSDPLLSRVAWDQALGRMQSRWGLVLSRPAPIAEDQLWAPALDAPQRPSWPRWEVGLLAVYALLVGLAVVVFREARLGAGRVIGLLLIVLAGGACIGVTRLQRTAMQTLIEVQRPGANGTVLSTGYAGIFDAAHKLTLDVPSGMASTVFTGRPVFDAVQGQDDLQLSHFVSTPPPTPQPTVARGVGGGAILFRGRRAVVRTAALPWELRTVQTVSLGKRGPDVEAKLRLTGASATSRGRLRGSVTNSGPAPIHGLWATTQEGQARLADVVAAGSTKVVDAPIVSALQAAADRRGVFESTEEAVMFAAAGRALTGPDQVALTAVTEPAKKKQKAGNRRIGIVVMVVPLDEADTIMAGSGGARLISASALTGGESVSVADLQVPPGTGPLSIRYIVNPPTIAQPAPARLSYDVYSWVTGTWRNLPPAGRPDHSDVITPLDGAEVNHGLVRLRGRSESPFFWAATGQLLLTRSTSEREATAGR